MTEAERIICRMYLEDVGTNKSCNEYQLIMDAINAPNDPEIIRCKDCINAYNDKLGLLWCSGMGVDPYHYCGYAERKDDG